MAAGWLVAGATLITVSTFVRQSSAWTQIVPTMDAIIHAANTLQTSLGSAVPSLSENKRNAIIAETSFLVASSDFSGEDHARQNLGFAAQRHFAGLKRTPGPEVSFSPDEWLEVGLLARITQRYTSELRGAVFSPSIPGCGVVDVAIGDVLAGSELIEIKTVTRPFRAYDFRQALTYAAMLYSSNYIVEYITLLNPRRARAVKMSVGEIAAGIRGDSAVELLQDLIEAMMDLQVSA
jgi:hypothetical protein